MVKKVGNVLLPMTGEKKQDASALSTGFPHLKARFVDMGLFWNPSKYNVKTNDGFGNKNKTFHRWNKNLC